MIVLCQEFSYIKDIRIYIVTWIINNNVATEITRLHKNMVASPRESSPSDNLAPPTRVYSSTNGPPFIGGQNSILNWVLKLNPLNQT